MKEPLMSLYDIEVTMIDGRPQKTEAYRDRTLLVVNVACRSGCTLRSRICGRYALPLIFRD